MPGNGHNKAKNALISSRSVRTTMKTNGTRHGLFAGILVILLVAAMFAGCGKEGAKSELQKGVDAYYARDYAKAVEHYRAAADMNDAEAQYQLGCCYAKAEGVPMNWDEAFRWWGKAAGQGHPESVKRMEDLRKLEETRKAAEQGDAEAQYRFAEHCFWGTDMEEDEEEAAKWFRKAAEQGHAEAQAQLGLCYFDGMGVEEDDAEAVKWWRRAADQDDQFALYRLGECYLDGIGVDMDCDKARECFRRAAEIKDAEDEVQYFGSESQKMLDAILAYEKNLSAAEQGDAEAQISVGEFFAGRRNSDEEAFKWYRKAAEQGHPEAQYELGLWYDGLGGSGVEEDEAEAVKWYRKAAEQGHDLARNALSICYEKGIGVAKDPDEAKKWKEMYLQSGVPVVLYTTGMQLAKRGRPGDVEEAVKYWRRAAEWKNPSLKAVPAVAAAQYQLGKCYYYGIVLQEDKAAGIEWFRKAAKNGDSDAKAMLDVLDSPAPQPWP